DAGQGSHGGVFVERGCGDDLEDARGRRDGIEEEAALVAPTDLRGGKHLAGSCVDQHGGSGDGLGPFEEVFQVLLEILVEPEGYFLVLRRTGYRSFVRETNRRPADG